MSPAGALNQPGYSDVVHPVAAPPRHTITITGARLFDGYLVLNYEVWPLPAALAEQKTMLEGDNSGIAIDSTRRTYRDCRSGYRASRFGSRLVGALRIGSADWHDLGELTVLFAPFAHTLGLRRALCEAKLVISGDQVRVASIRNG